MKTQKIDRNASGASNPKIKIYTTSTCPWCMKTKEFFKENHIKYDEANVGTNEEARNQMFEKSGQLGVPVIDVNGTIIVGFDKNALKKALKI
jgi:glutaredoxin 3